MADKRQMKILMLPRYGKSGPSSRYRFYQYSDVLKEHNIDLKISPLFSDKYVDDLFYNGHRSNYEVITGLMKRIFILFTFFKYDLIVIEYELLPYFPALFESLCKIFGKKYIADYDDAIFVRYNQSKAG